ncbi:MAG: methyl-accepting chemotaxis protein [Janthinobacterium lividum]
MNLSIKQRLSGSIALFLVLLIGIGGLGLFGMSRAVGSLNDIYTNELAGTTKLGISHAATLQVRTTLDRAALMLTSTAPEPLLGAATDLRAVSDAAWASYMTLPQDAKEADLARATADRRADLYAKIDAFAAAIRAHADATAVNAANTEIGTAFRPFREASEKLMTYQSTQAEQLYNAALANYAWVRNLVIVAFVIALLVAALTIRSLLRAITGPLETALSHFSEMEQGDLRRPVVVTSRDEMGQLLNALSVVKLSLADTVSTIRHSAESIASAAGEIASGNLDLSSRTEEQAAALAQTAASMAQLTQTVKQNADNAEMANELTIAARNSSLAGGEVVSQVYSTMKTIDESSGKMADIISIIEGIAFQTNILALNAAVEAARAGEQGRGFAVVAGEVRNLAQRSASASKDIKGLIDASVQNTRQGNRLVDDASNQMRGISESITRVTSIVAEISTASQEQSKGIDQVAVAVTQMDTVTQQNAALVEEASAAAQSMAAQAETLRHAVSRFQVTSAGVR